MSFSNFSFSFKKDFFYNYENRFFIYKKKNICKKRNIYIKNELLNNLKNNYFSNFYILFNKYKTYINRKLNYFNLNYKDNSFFSYKKDNICKFNIAIDPGHGGKDPGAIGFSGSKEKDITLTISKKLLKIINSYGKFNAFLIRNSDKYISLKKRLIIARKKNANLFISIHVNSINNNKYVEGASVWILSTLNKYKNLNNKNLLNFSNDFYFNYYLNKSKYKKYEMNFYLALEILNKFNNVIFLHKNIPQYANLMVLTLFDIPSVLIETGYISNPYEEKKLGSDFYQKVVAKYIYLGINDFINKICFFL